MTEAEAMVGSKIAEALAKAQGEIKNPSATAENPAFKRDGKVSKYANLADGLDAIRSALSKNNICVTQTTRTNGDVLMLDTRLIHSSGECISSEWPIGLFAKLSPQQMGSALTYARRYSLFPIVGIASQDDDDDGNGASGKGWAPPPPSARESIDLAKVVEIESALRDTESDKDKFLHHLGAESVDAMTFDQYKRAKSLLETKKQKAYLK